jgi:SAM-dependent methyltransferase
LVSVSVEPLPAWIDAARLLGVAPSAREALPDGCVRVLAQLPLDQAAYLAARLRGLGFDGRALQVQTRPPLSRSQVRGGRLAEARARREITPGFLRRDARATGEGRYSLTPEALALALGQEAAGRSVVEACAGSGGNSIGFARAGCQVTAVELSAERLAEARHNAAVYGVAQRIRFVQGDALEEVPRLRADLLFIDPPWSEEYDKARTTRESFPLLSEMLARDLSGYREIWLKVPSSFAVASVPGAAPSAWFGTATGDFRRVKFVLLKLDGSELRSQPRD